MRIHYNVTGRERKALVNVIAGITGAHPIYRFMPTCAYDIGCFTVTKDGTLEFSEHMDSNEVEAVLHALIEAGFEGVGESNAETADVEAGDGEQSMAPTETETAPTEAHTAPTEPDDADSAGEDAALTISLPMDGFNPDALDRLVKLVDSKAALIRKALNAVRLTIRTEGDKVSFPWWDVMPDPNETQAFMSFIAALGKMAREAKRVTAKEAEVESEKYAFRCFLIRLGFVGEDFKTQRKILMHRLSGSAAFPSREKADAFSAAQKARRNTDKPTENMEVSVCE